MWKYQNFQEQKQGISERKNWTWNKQNKNVKDLHTDINEFKKGYKTKTNLVK